MRLRTIPMERVGTVDLVHAMAGRIAFVIAELDQQSCCCATRQPFTETQWRSSSDAPKLFKAACCKLGLPLNAATRLTDSVRAALLTRQLSSCQGPLGQLESFCTLLGDEALQLRSDVLTALSWRPHTAPQLTPLLPTSGSVALKFVLRSLRQQRCWRGAGISLRAPVRSVIRCGDASEIGGSASKARNILWYRAHKLENAVDLARAAL